MAVGFNIHGASGFNKGELFNHVAKLPPAPHVMLDQPQLAVELQQHIGQTVYHRSLKDLGSDDNLQHRISPAQFINHVQTDIDAGLGVYANNEPAWSQECIDWLLDVAQRLVAQNAKGVLGNFSIGTPEPTLEVFDRIEPLIRYIQAHSDLLALGLHEGGLNHWTNGIDGFDYTNIHDFDVTTASMWYSGRFRRLYVFGHFPIIITEWTWDDIGGNSDGGPIHKIAPIWDRLYGRHDTQQFAAEQVAQVVEHVYAPYNIPICLYCWGAAAPRWLAYDFSTAIQFQRELERLIKPKEFPMATKIFQVSTSNIINIRSAPSANTERIGSLKHGDIIEVYMDGNQPIIVEDEGYAWIRLVEGDKDGYAASDFFELVEVTPTSSIKKELQSLANQLQNAISRLD